MNMRQYLKTKCPYLTEEHIGALLQFKRIEFPQLNGSSIVIQRYMHQETFQHPFVVLKWEGETGSRRERQLHAFELLLLAEAIKHEFNKEQP